MIEIFKTLKNGKWAQGVIFDPSPTRAMSLVTSSTLSAMRKHARTVQPNSHFKTTFNPVEQWIDLTANEITVNEIIENEITMNNVSANEITVDEISDIMDEFIVSELKATVVNAKPESGLLGPSTSSQSESSSPGRTESTPPSSVQEEIPPVIKEENRRENVEDIQENNRQSDVLQGTQVSGDELQPRDGG